MAGTVPSIIDICIFFASKPLPHQLPICLTKCWGFFLLQTLATFTATLKKSILRCRFFIFLLIIISAKKNSKYPSLMNTGKYLKLTFSRLTKRKKHRSFRLFYIFSLFARHVCLSVHGGICTVYKYISVKAGHTLQLLRQSGTVSRPQNCRLSHVR